MVSFTDIQAAAERIRPHTHRTPVVTCAAVNAQVGADVFFKCENLQKVGAFKARGAINAVAQLAQDVRARGVVAHSSGNHAQALALAGRAFGAPVVIAMPDGAPEVKRQATLGYGAEVVRCENTQVGREGTTARLIDERGLTLVHPFEDPAIIAGQGTACLELLDDVPDLEVVLAPIGGGGLLSGTSLVCRERGVDILGCEPEQAGDAAQSLRQGKRIEEFTPNTIADGLRTKVGERPFAILSRLEVPVVTVSEGQILDAMQLVWERAKILIEPSAAVAVAVALQERQRLAGKRVGLILSGGNVDVAPFFGHLRKTLS